MARIRLGVALLLPSPVREEVDGLRRALGDGSLDRAPAHLTLVPPVNVRRESLGAALAIVRRAAAASPRRLTLTLGPVTTFLPDSPVICLAVGGDLEALRQLRDRVFSGPLERPLTWSFVPHVTLADHADPGGIPAAVETLSHYHAEVTVEAVHLLQEVGHGADRRWEPVADAALGPAAVVGRGGLALELSRSHLVDPEARALIEAESPDPSDGPAGCRRPPIVITGRRESVVAGLAAAWLADDGGHIAVLVASTHRRQGIGSHLLAAAEAAVADQGWACEQLAAAGPDAFYRARSDWSVAACYSKTIDE